MRALRWLPQALARPSFLGAAYVLTLAFCAEQTPAVGERQAGTQAHQIDALVHGRFGGEIVRVGVAVACAAALLGALLGGLAAGLLALRDAARGRPHPRAPLQSGLVVLAMVASLHAALELWGMADSPTLYAEAWYARGGWRRTTQVLATDVLTPGGVIAVVVAATLVFLTGPPWRWSDWPARAVASLRGVRLRKAPLAASAIASAIAVFALTRVPSARAGAQLADVRPNVLVLAADSLRADRLDPRTTPRLAALAALGTRFDRAYVSLPRTFPSWVTLLTGRHPHHHGIRSMFPRWEERARDFDALPERLGRAGWSTAVVSDYAGDIFSRIDLGFDTIDVPEFDFRQLVRQRVLERETPLLSVLHSRLGRAAFPVMRELNDAADPALLAADAVRTMHSLAARGPFFLVVFFSTAHFPYAAPSPFYRRFTDPAYRGRFKYDKPVGLGRESFLDSRDESQVRALYDGAVLAIDGAAQSILDAVANSGLQKKTIVVVTADHGETLYDHGHGQGHGDHLFGDEGTHVPLVIFDPRKTTARHEPAIVRDVDLAPTLYELTGVAPPSDLDGQSLVAALDGQSLPPALAFAETGLWFTEEIPGLPTELRLPYPGIARLTEVDTEHGDDVVLQESVRPLTMLAKHRMVRDDRWKLVYVPARIGVRWMLFDTREDPGEETDVAAAHPDVVARLQGELWAWMRCDREMTERGGYLVPRVAEVLSRPAVERHLLRIDDAPAASGPDVAALPGTR